MTAGQDLDRGIVAAGFSASSSAPAVIHAARRLFDEVPFREVTVGMIAREADVNEVTIYRIFGSKDALAAACWVGNIVALRRGIARDRRELSDPLERLCRHLNRFARIALMDRAVTFALLQAVQAQTIERGSKIADLDPRSIVPLPTLADPLVADAQEAGQLTTKYSSFEIAAFITNSMLTRLMTRQQVPAAESAALTLDIVLYGLTTGS